jgi:hypothetical protein
MDETILRNPYDNSFSFFLKEEMFVAIPAYVMMKDVEKKVIALEKRVIVLEQTVEELRKKS